MSSRKYHNRECMEKLGEDFDHVNAWIDGCAAVTNPEGVKCLDINHRIHRHHKEGVEHIRQEHGERAAKAAELHIKRDMGEIWSKEKMLKVYGKEPRPVPWAEIFGSEWNEDS